MSYDFHLFLPQPGIDPLVTAQADTGEDSEEINPGPSIPAKEARKRAIADALMKADPTLEVCQFDFEKIASYQKVTTEEARVRFRHMELNGPDDGPGIQITLSDNNATLTVPYWHKDQEAKAVFAQIWKYLQVIQKVGGYQVYDPQMECLINLASDLERVTKVYTDVVDQEIE